MLENQKIESFKQSAEKYIQDYPEQIKDSIHEYLSCLHPSIKDIIEHEFLEKPDYYKRFQLNIFYTSQILMLIGQKTLFPDLNIEGILNDFLQHSAGDDRHIFNMKIYYFESIGSSEMQIGQVNLIRSQEILNKESQELLMQEAERKARECDGAILDFKNKYLNFIQSL